jgi:hypothetical protein
MQTINTSGTFEAAISTASPQAQQLAQALRQLIEELCPNVFEVPWPKQRVIGYGIGPKKQTEHFCNIGVHDQYVNLGFTHGTDLADPEHLLAGSGKTYRHVKVQDLKAVSLPALRSLLQAAVKEREHALGKSSLL